MKRLLSLLLLLCFTLTLSASPAVVANNGTALVVSGITVNGALYDAHFVWGTATAAQASAKTFIGAGHLHEVTLAVNAALTAYHATAVRDTTGAFTSDTYAIPEVFYADRPFPIGVGQWRQDGNWYARYESYTPVNFGFSTNQPRMWVLLTPSVSAPPVESIGVALATWALWFAANGGF